MRIEKTNVQVNFKVLKYKNFKCIETRICADEPRRLKVSTREIVKYHRNTTVQM